MKTLRATPHPLTKGKEEESERACDAKVGDPPNKKHIKYEGGGNKTGPRFKDEMVGPTEK